MQKRSCYLIPVLICCFLACNTAEEGCLDLNAVNFDLNADKPCPDCCNYPSLFLNILNRWDDRTFVPDSIYQTNTGQSVRISAFKFYVSEIRLNSDTEQHQVIDTLSLPCDIAGTVTTLTITDDLVLVAVPSFNYRVGEWRENASLISYALTLGIPESYQCVQGDQVPSNHPLSETNGLWSASAKRYALGEVILERNPGISEPDTIVLEDTSVMLTLPTQTDTNIGGDDAVPLEIDYAVLFADIDLTTSTTSEIGAHIVNRFAQAVSLRE